MTNARQTAALLAFTIYMFTQHPEVAVKARAEVLEHIGPDRTPGPDELKKLKYRESIPVPPPSLYLSPSSTGGVQRNPACIYTFAFQHTGIRANWTIASSLRCYLPTGANVPPAFVDIYLFPIFVTQKPCVVG